MDWKRVANDEIDETLAHFVGLTSASQARVCELVGEVDRRQQFLADGSRSLTDWLSARFSIRNKTARQLVLWRDGFAIFRCCLNGSLLVNFLSTRPTPSPGWLPLTPEPG
ncbi:MAG: hypothetical protein V3S32_04955 [Acidimicrobiia bacterium]